MNTEQTLTPEEQIKRWKFAAEVARDVDASQSEAEPETDFHSLAEGSASPECLALTVLGGACLLTLVLSAWVFIYSIGGGI